MTILIVFDAAFDVTPIKKLLKKRALTISLFALTSNFLIIEKVKKALEDFPNVTVKEINSASAINDAVNHLQTRIHTWSRDIGNLTIKKRTLKEWFLMPDGGGSAWWLGLLSEKNSVQDDTFFKIAQLNAFHQHLIRSSPKHTFIAVSDRQLRKYYQRISRTVSRTTLLNVLAKEEKISTKAKIMQFITSVGTISAFVSAFIHWLIWLRDSRDARKMLPDLKQRLKRARSFLFVTYFPNLDEELAKEGRFRNKYALALQDKLDALTIPVTWLLMPVFYNGHNFQSAMQLANKLSQAGENIFVLQEFFRFPIFLKAFIWWVRQCILSGILFRLIDKKMLVKDFTHEAALPLVNYLWRHSFIGTSGVRGIIFYLTYREVFKKLSNIKTCLYYCEMQAWEKALLMAKHQVAPKIKALAFQHTVVMRNYFNYFYDPEEIKNTNKQIDLPLPDKLIANGKVNYALLAACCYPNLCEAEAIRQLYLNHTHTNDDVSPTHPVLLVVGSYDRNETKSLLTMVIKAFGKTDTFKIMLKASPVNPMSPLFAEIGVDPKALGYDIVDESIDTLLKRTSIALVGNTTVAIEAAVYGCTVVIPIFADTMLMNPIVETNAPYQLVSNIEELKAAVAATLKETHRNSSKTHASDYWYIEPHLPRWTALLKTMHYATD